MQLEYGFHEALMKALLHPNLCSMILWHCHQRCHSFLDYEQAGDTTSSGCTSTMTRSL